MPDKTVKELIEAFEDYRDAVEQYLDGEMASFLFDQRAAEAEAIFKKADRANF